MNRRIYAAILAAAAALPMACGDDAGSHAPVAADKLPPLSADDMEKIKSEDARVEAEERGTPVYATGKKKKGTAPAKDPAAEQ